MAIALHRTISAASTPVAGSLSPHGALVGVSDGLPVVATVAFAVALGLAAVSVTISVAVAVSVAVATGGVDDATLVGIRVRLTVVVGAVAATVVALNAG